jgi:hypothetical protein
LISLQQLARISQHNFSLFKVAVINKKTLFCLLLQDGFWLGLLDGFWLGFKHGFLHGLLDG